MAHEHGSGHGHSHTPADFGKAFAIGAALNIVYVIFELVFGGLSHSLALVTDAVHNMGDVLGLLLAWFTTILGRRIPTVQRTYGLRRSSVLSSLTNAVVLIITTSVVGYEAIRRFWNLKDVAGGTVIWVALIGVAINAVTAFLFAAGRKGDLNLRGVFVHFTADAALALGVAVTGLVILLTGWHWLDPVISLVLVAVILYETWDLLRESVNLALDAVPEGIDMGEVRAYLASLPGVTEVHDLHVWGMSTTETALTAHLVIPVLAGSIDGLLCQAMDGLHEQFEIVHPTLQVETGDPAYPCHLATAGSV